MSEQLKAFYKSYAAWLDAGAPHTNPFSQSAGLCSSLLKFIHSDYDVLNEMTVQFSEAGLDQDFPFDNGDPDLYFNDLAKYLNPDRRAWIRKHAAD